MRPRPGRRLWRRPEPPSVDPNGRMPLACPRATKEPKRRRNLRYARRYGPDEGTCSGRQRARQRAGLRWARRHRDPTSVQDLRSRRRRRYGAERYSLLGRKWRVPDDRRPVRLRQVDAPEDPRRSDAGDRRRGAPQRHAHQGTASGHRRRVPVAGAVSLAHRARQRAAAGRRAAARAREDGASARSTCWRSSGSLASSTATHGSFPAACSSASRWCAR